MPWARLVRRPHGIRRRPDLILVGLLPFALAFLTAALAWWPHELGSGPAAADLLPVTALGVAALGWAVPAVVLGRRLLWAPEVDAGDVAFVVRDPAPGRWAC